MIQIFREYIARSSHNNNGKTEETADFILVPLKCIMPTFQKEQIPNSPKLYLTKKKCNV